MKNRIGVTISLLVLACVGLAIALVVIKKHASERQHELTEDNGTLSNSLAQTQEELNWQRQTNAFLKSDREKQRQTLEELTNNYSQVVATLSQVRSEERRV